ncbi:MAG: hypothetical protein ACK4IY_00365 [Chitinophagales bacterium]
MKKISILYFFLLCLYNSAIHAQANQQLSNLTGAPDPVVAINQSLVADSDNDTDLGSTTFTWRNLYLGNTLFLTVPPASGGGSAAPQKLIYINNVPFMHNTGGGIGTDNEGAHVGGNAGLNINYNASVNNGCVAFGYNALQNLGAGYPGVGGTSDKTGIGNHNTAIGWRSLFILNGTLSEMADKNTMVGSRSGESIDYGKENTGIGWNVFSVEQMAWAPFMVLPM